MDAHTFNYVFETTSSTGSGGGPVAVLEPVGGHIVSTWVSALPRAHRDVDDSEWSNHHRVLEAAALVLHSFASALPFIGRNG